MYEWNTKTANNGHYAEELVADRFHLKLVRGEWDEEDENGVKYEIKSCQKYIANKQRKRGRGRFVLEKKDFEDNGEEKKFIFVVLDGKELEWWGEISGEKLKSLKGKRKISQKVALNYILTYGKMYEK